MSETARVSIAFAGAAAMVAVSTPIAIRLALRTGFLDRPAGYKTHDRVTPYLGGAAVVLAFALLAALVGEGAAQLMTLLAVALVLLAVGTIDDRLHLGIGIRVAFQVGAALVLWADGLRWEPTGIAVLDLLLTVFWVVGIANAFNLLDNIDGAAAATAATSAAGLGVLAIIEGASTVAAVAFALSGACAAFLLFNLASPSRIFLGDGGSVPIGLVLAALAMMIPASAGSPTPILAAIPMVGVAVFDTSLVVTSRLRRGAAVLSGGRDHLTHRLLSVVNGPRAVALLLAIVQALLCALGILISGLPGEAAVLIAVGYVAAGITLLVRLETPPFVAPQHVEQPA